MTQNAVRDKPNMEFQVVDCEAIPFDDNIMDIITACAAYHHFPDVKSFAREAKRALKTSGSICIGEVHKNAFFCLVCNPFSPFSNVGDVKFYSPNQIT